MMRKQVFTMALKNTITKENLILFINENFDKLVDGEQINYHNYKILYPNMSVPDINACADTIKNLLSKKHKDMSLPIYAFLNKEEETPENSEYEKELHVWLTDNYPANIFVSHSLNSALALLNNNVPIVHTTQTHCFTTEWIGKGYHIFAHLLDGNVVEIKFGKNTCTNREIRPSHNIEKMLLANAFGEAVKY